MEQHPVPQNVTTFQFRLIGDMTIKQFGYLCGGAILAIISYKLPLPFFFTWPAALGFGFLGIGFAFIPVEERPMDVWVFSFFKSIYSPTQYVWSRETKAPEKTQQVKPQPAPTAHPVAPMQAASLPAVAVTPPSPPSAKPNNAILSNLFGTPSVPAQPQVAPHPQVVSLHPKKSWLDGVTSFLTPKPKVTAPPPQATMHIPSVTGHKPPEPKHEVVTPPPTHESVATQQKMLQLEASLKGLQDQLTTKSVTEERVLELQKQLTSVMSEKEKMETELSHLKRKMEVVAPPPTPPALQAPPGPPGLPTVNVISSQDAAVKVGLPRLTNVANVITGLIKDDGGNLLPGILVTVTNTEGIPMRAFKTNKLGQFGASTPLPHGTYLVEAEDPRDRFTFDRAQITLTGVVLPALEIIAKSQKQLVREKLAQEIFGNKVQ